MNKTKVQRYCWVMVKNIRCLREDFEDFEERCNGKVDQPELYLLWMCLVKLKTVEELFGRFLGEIELKGQ